MQSLMRAAIRSSRPAKDAYDLGGEFLRGRSRRRSPAGYSASTPSTNRTCRSRRTTHVRLLKTYEDQGALPDPGVRLGERDRLARRLMAHLKLVRKNDYVAITRTSSARRNASACYARSAPRSATASGSRPRRFYGPRFLHSTGQLHKGGAANGLFIQLRRAAEDLAIPGEKFTFGVPRRPRRSRLRSLAKRERRALRVSLGADVDARHRSSRWSAT